MPWSACQQSMPFTPFTTLSTLATCLLIWGSTQVLNPEPCTPLKRHCICTALWQGLLSLWYGCLSVLCNPPFGS